MNQTQSNPNKLTLKEFELRMKACEGNREATQALLKGNIDHIISMAQGETMLSMFTGGVVSHTTLILLISALQFMFEEWVQLKSKLQGLLEPGQ